MVLKAFSHDLLSRHNKGFEEQLMSQSHDSKTKKWVVLSMNGRVAVYYYKKESFCWPKSEIPY